MPGPLRVPAPSAGVISRPVGDDYVVIHQPTQHAHALSGPLALVWRAAHGDAAAVSALDSADLAAAIAALQEAGLLEGATLGRRAMTRRAAVVGGVTVSASIATIALPEAAVAASTTYSPTLSDGTYGSFSTAIPADVNTINFTLVGAGGGSRVNSFGGGGATITGTIKRAGGLGNLTLSGYVGQGGQPGDVGGTANTPGGAGGSGGTRSGGAGGTGVTGTGTDFRPGAGGGAASTITIAGVDVVVAAGGGGAGAVVTGGGPGKGGDANGTTGNAGAAGGAGGTGGAGGAAGVSGPGSAGSAGGNGALAAGGGGGGNNGGTGGTGNAGTGGGGGGSGRSFTTPSGYTVSVTGSGTAANATTNRTAGFNGSISIFYRTAP